MNRLIPHMRRLRRNDEGAALVEMGLILPLILVIFAVTIEGSRMMWSYQATIAGVRDAARYVGRAETTDICAIGGDLSGWNSTITAIVRESSTGTALFPASITVQSVEAALECVTGDFRLAATPIVTVTAALQITYPFQSVFEWVGAGILTTNTVVSDSSRIFGA